MKKRESEYRGQFLQYVVTQVPLTGLWVTKGHILVKEDEILKVFPLSDPTELEFTTEDDAEIYILNAAKKAVDGLLERQLMERSQINVEETKKIIDQKSRIDQESYTFLRLARPVATGKGNLAKEEHDKTDESIGVMSGPNPVQEV